MNPLKAGVWRIKNHGRLTRECQRKDDILLKTGDLLYRLYRIGQDHDDIKLRNTVKANASGCVVGPGAARAERIALKKAKQDFKDAGYDWKEELNKNGYKNAKQYKKEQNPYLDEDSHNDK